jgi:membrane AbrB-like protein
MAPPPAGPQPAAVAPTAISPAVVARTLAVAALGALAGWAVGAPAYVLTGPAAAVAAAALAGWPMALPDRLRDAAFLTVGVTTGAAVDPQAAAALGRWPVALGAVVASATLAMILCAAMLRRMGDPPRDAVLAATPGHLSMVLALGLSLRADVGRVTVIQSTRLLGLTLAAPLLAAAMGATTQGTGLLAPGEPMGIGALAGTLAAAMATAWGLGRLGAPAPLLLGGLIASGVAHGGGLASGAPPAWLALPAFVVLGALIGQRFGVQTARPGALRRSLWAGLAATVVSVGCAAAAALPVAAMLDMPLGHVLIAFAPGGLETMVAMGAALGADPGFVAACHVARLAWLGALLPVMLRRAGAAQDDPKG